MRILNYIGEKYWQKKSKNDKKGHFLEKKNIIHSLDSYFFMEKYSVLSLQYVSNV